jgi:hypothetical protein
MDFAKLVAEMGEENLVANCCKFLLLSTVRPTPEQRSDLIKKLEQDKRYEELREPVNEVSETDNWVQCSVYGCDQWHKLPTTIDPNSLSEKWVCADNTWSPKKQCAAEKPQPFVRDGPAPKAPNAAENFWPAARAKRFVKHFYSDLRPCHMEALAILARRRGLTLEQLYRMSPRDYLENRYLERQLMGLSYMNRGY